MNLSSVFGILARSPNIGKATVFRYLSDYKSKFEFLDKSTSVLLIKALGDMSRRGFINLGSPKIQDVLQLALVDVTRHSHILTPWEVSDVLCVGSNKYLISRLLNAMSSYSTRQLSLCVWSIFKNGTDDSSIPAYASIVGHILDNPHRIMEMSSRDWSLVLYTGCKHISRFSGDTDHVKQLNRIVNILVSENVKFKTFQEVSLCIYSLGKLVEVQKKNNMDCSMAKSCVNLVIPQMAQYVTRRRQMSDTMLSTNALLACLFGLGKFGFKAQPILVDLFRIMYRRVDTMSSDQCAFVYYMFCCESGLSDGDIKDRLFSGIKNIEDLSNTNLVNVIKALSQGGIAADAVKFLDHTLVRKMSPHEQVTCIECAVAVIKNSDDVVRYWSTSFPPTMKNCKSMTAHQLVRLFVCQRKIGENSGIKNALSIGLIHRLKEKNHSQWSPEELVLFATELGRVIQGPYSRNYHPIKPNLKQRFFRHLWISIKHRRIPTHILMNNLVLLDQIGTFKRLPFDLQQHLWAKASDQQKGNMRPPEPPKVTPNSWRRDLMNSKQLLVRIPTKEERRAMWVKHQQQGGRTDNNITSAKEDLEIGASALAGNQTPISQFIESVRKHN